ncbi:MAG: hypothetical protein NC416_09415, partial [Eubacterium sp.]|nr:hypothetical protein [Eubacterium sp.]
PGGVITKPPFEMGVANLVTENLLHFAGIVGMAIRIIGGGTMSAVIVSIHGDTLSMDSLDAFDFSR